MTEPVFWPMFWAGVVCVPFGILLPVFYPVGIILMFVAIFG